EAEARSRAEAARESEKIERHKAEVARESEKAERTKAETARKAEAAERQRAESSLYTTRLSLAFREWMSNHITSAEDILAKCPEDYRGWEWRYLKRLCHTEIWRIPTRVQLTRFSPSGRYMIGVVPARSEVKVWDTITGIEVRALPVQASVL